MARRSLANCAAGSIDGGTVEVYPKGRFRALSVGRDRGCDVWFSLDRDGMVYRNQVVMEWQMVDGEPLRVWVSDLLWRNGTFVNGEQVGRAAPLWAGDIPALDVAATLYARRLSR